MVHDLKHVLVASYDALSGRILVVGVFIGNFVEDYADEAVEAGVVCDQLLEFLDDRMEVIGFGVRVNFLDDVFEPCLMDSVVFGEPVPWSMDC